MLETGNFKLSVFVTICYCSFFFFSLDALKILFSDSVSQWFFVFFIYLKESIYKFDFEQNLCKEQFTFFFIENSEN